MEGDWVHTDTLCGLRKSDSRYIDSHGQRWRYCQVYEGEPIRPYTFHELVQHVASGRDETNYGYIVGLTENCVTFKRNDIAETRTLSDCSDVTWANGSPFGVTP